MSYLALSVLMNVGLFVAFRTFGPWKIHVFQAVTVNYLVCSVLSGIALWDMPINVVWPLNEPWHYIAIFLGSLFVGTFYVMGLTTRNFGITIATVASKMSLIIPVLFGLFVLGIVTSPFNIWNYLGVALALTSVILTTIKGKSPIKVPLNNHWFLPIILFLLAGGLDTLVNYTNYRYLNPELEMPFIWLIFTTASICGLIILLIRRQPVRLRSIGGGLYLGIPNFFSMYFILRALTAFSNNGAILFPIFNVGIIVLSTLAALTIFKEQLLTINKLGILLAVLSVLMISYRELLIWWDY